MSNVYKFASISATTSGTPSTPTVIGGANPTPVTVSSITSQNGVATVTTATAHSLLIGATITIAGATGPSSAFNGVVTVASSDYGTKFTFLTSYNGTGTGTITYTVTTFPIYAVDDVTVQNLDATATLKIGPNSSANAWPIPAGAFGVIPAVRSTKASSYSDISGWYVQSTGTSISYSLVLTPPINL